MKIKGKCEECIYFHYEENKISECRRPKVIFKPPDTHWGKAGSGSASAKQITLFPTVALTDWCGEFRSSL